MVIDPKEPVAIFWSNDRSPGNGRSPTRFMKSEVSDCGLSRTANEDPHRIARRMAASGSRERGADDPLLSFASVARETTKRGGFNRSTQRIG